MKHFEFIKLSNRWFVDIPYEGNVNDLEMVFGADTFLESYSDNKKIVHVYIPEIDKDYTDYTFEIVCNKVYLKKKCQDKNGTTYEVDSTRYRGDVWLCPVFNMLIGESPEKLYVGIISDM
jgi:hypothetical protein